MEKKWKRTWFGISSSFKDWHSRLQKEKHSLWNSRRGRIILAVSGIAAVCVIFGGCEAYRYFHTRDYQMRAKLAYDAGGYKDALENYQKLADMGDREAMFKTSEMYLEGQGTPKNPEKAVYYLKKAANAGSSLAETKLGMLYFASSGESRTCLEHNYLQAREWFLKAGNEPDALEALGTIYQKGLGVAKDEKKAQQYFDQWIKGYQKKAEAGDAKSQYIMGLYFSDGLRHDRDDARAISWYEKSGLQEYVPALESLGMIYTLGGSQIKPNKEKADEVFKKLRSIYEKQIEQGNTDAMIALSGMYQDGMGVKKDLNKAVSYLIKASEADSAGAMLIIADMLDTGVIKSRALDEKEKFEKEREESAKRIRAQLEAKKAHEAELALANSENKTEEAPNSEKLTNGESDKTSPKDAPVTEKATENNVAKVESGTESSEASESETEVVVQAGGAVQLSMDDSTQDEGDTATNPVSTEENQVQEQVVTTEGMDESQNNAEFEDSTLPALVDLPDDYTSDKLRLRALEIKKEKASLGNVTQMKELAFNALSHDGFMVTDTASESGIDYVEAINWFTRAAQEGGDPEAMYELGHIYQESDDPSIKNEALADNWYRKSADLCYMPAYIGLGNLYGTQGSSLEDARKSQEWYEKAAKLGNQDAQMALAKALAQGGKGAQPDFKQALKWLLVVKLGLEKVGDKSSDYYKEIKKLEDTYEHYLQQDEIAEVKKDAENMREQYGTNW